MAEFPREPSSGSLISPGSGFPLKREGEREPQRTCAREPVPGSGLIGGNIAPDPYATLRAVLDEAYQQSANGKGRERHATPGAAFEEQPIVQLGEWMDGNHFQIGQACKKALESTRLPPEKARAELLGAIVYLAAAVVQLDRRGR